MNNPWGPDGEKTLKNMYTKVELSNEAAYFMHMPQLVSLFLFENFEPNRTCVLYLPTCLIISNLILTLCVSQ